MRPDAPRKDVAGTIIASKRAGGITLTEHVYSCGAHFPRHTHGESVLTVVLEGGYRERLSGRLEECWARTVRYLPADEPHSDEFPERAACLVARIDPHVLERARQHAAVIDRPGEISSPAVPLLGTRLYREFKISDPCAELAIEAIVYEILVEAARAERGVRSSGPAWMRTAKELLRDQFATRLTIERIAEAAGVHPVHLCREFRKQEGCTIGEHLRSLRVEHACSLLLESKLSLAEVAQRCGFCDQSHFTSVFKRMVGKTPGEFRAPAL